MQISIFPSHAHGKIKAIASKSVAHRALICAAFSDIQTLIVCEETNKDIEATAACLNAIGAYVRRVPNGYIVEPFVKKVNCSEVVLPCNESGSTLRFLLPVTAALGIDCSFSLNGRLPDRPLSPLREELESHGITLSGKNPIHLTGKLIGTNFSIDGGVSSQFVSGLLMALSLIGHSCRLTVTGNMESAPYIDITCDVLSMFGITIRRENNVFYLESQKLVSPKTIRIEGDWSNAAFALALGAVGGDVEISGLDAASSQGDSAVVEILRKFGASIEYNEITCSYKVHASKLSGIDIDASQIPDLVPVLATVAAVADGKTVIHGASRLRMKESDRLQSTSDMLNALGANVKITDDGLIINGVRSLNGGVTESYNDHRIAMSAAVASSACRSEVVLTGADAVEKSYPSFWDDLSLLGIKILRKT